MQTLDPKITRFQTLILVDTPRFNDSDWSKIYKDIHKNDKSDGGASDYSEAHGTYLIPAIPQESVHRLTRTCQRVSGRIKKVYVQDEYDLNETVAILLGAMGET